MVVRGDPAARIGDIRNVEIVFKAGLRHSNQASAASPARADGRSSDR